MPTRPAASPYSPKQRKRLVTLAERVHKNKRYGIKTKEEKWAALRRLCTKVALPLPSFAQYDWALKALKERARSRHTKGLLHQRYRGIRFATQEVETDSTQIQAFTDSEVAADVKLRNPTWYKDIDVATGYIPGVYLTYSGPSSHCLSELLFISMTGLAGECARLGLPYTAEDFRPLHPPHYLWADNQELLSKKLNHALTRHFNTKVKLAIVGDGADKGVMEGSFGQSKRTLRRRPGFITKHASGKLVAIARRKSVGTRDELLREIIVLTWEENHRELPANRLPAAFVATGRPLNRKELYLWYIRAYPELIRAIPPRETLAKLLLPVESYRVHAGKGIYVEGRYYTSNELIASGILKARAHGDAPQVEVAFHRGTAAFVYWLRTPDDYVKCPLVALDNAVYANMTVDEAKMHDESMPSSRKRQRKRLINSSAQQSQARNRDDRKKIREATDKREVTKDKNRIAGIRRLEKNRQDKNDAQNRYGQLNTIGDEAISHLQEKPTDVATSFDDMMAQRVENLMKERLKKKGDRNE